MGVGRRVRLVCLFVAAAAGSHGCVREHRLSLVLSLPAGTSSELAYELWVLRDGVACPAAADLALGRAPDAEQVLHSQSFSGTAGMEIGRLPSGRASFVALARRADCTPALFGCAIAEVGRDASVTIELEPVSWSSADGCGPGRACDREGACRSRLDGGLPDGGADSGAADGGLDGGMDDGGIADGGLDGGLGEACPDAGDFDGGPRGPAWMFEEIAMGSSIETSFPDSGIARSAVDVDLRDLDDDGDLDLAIVDRHGWPPNGSLRTRLLVQEAGDFRDITEAAFGSFAVRAEIRQGSAALFAPFSGTDRLDLLGLAHWGGSAYRNASASGEPRYEVMTELPGAEGGVAGGWAATGDIDGDGWLDLVVAREVARPLLYVSRGTAGAGWIEDAASRLPADLYAVTRPILADFDGDGDLDLLLQMQIDWVSGVREEWDASPLTARYLENDGAGRFTDRSVASGIAAHLFLDGASALGDLDNDGDLDLVQFGLAHELPPGDPGPRYLPGDLQVVVLRNDLAESGRFTDVTDGAFPGGEPILYDTWHPNEMGLVEDLDNDGWQDVLIMRMRPRVLENRGAIASDRISFFERHTDETSPLRFGSFGRLAAGDLEGDGDIDFAATDEGPHGVRLFRNGRGGHGVVQVRLRGRPPNAHAIGAHVRVYRVDEATGRRGRLAGYRHVIASTSHHTWYTQHFGLPEAGCYEVEVTWPPLAGSAPRVSTMRVASSDRPLRVDIRPPE